MLLLLQAFCSLSSCVSLLVTVYNGQPHGRRRYTYIHPPHVRLSEIMFAAKGYQVNLWSFRTGLFHTGKWGYVGFPETA